ncbi:DUF4199 domain-containing protein [Mesonia ostreae]|uniref:DUF4199 domain-containing protein n=1 Tax=Mesonia ostreae TaxID=861110 RepID=A0ABU2KKV8_9FLAO|nr:DUF4199 domain-containing protein [Mesonia ostreae]MDT0295361.1 DUF4199 domain-containing protein [Mesonia ostreae]
MESTNNVKSIASSIGLILGISLSLFIVLIYAFNLELLTQWYISIIEFLIIVGLGVYSCSKAKANFTEPFTFKSAFSAFFISIAIGSILYTVVNYILFNFIDPEAANYIVEVSIEKMKETMASFGGTQEQINLMVTEMEGENQFSLANQAIGLAFKLVFYSVIGLLVALVFKEKSNQGV